MPSLHFGSVFALSHSPCSHLPSLLESSKDKIHNIFIKWNQIYPKQKTHLCMDHPPDNNARTLPILQLSEYQLDHTCDWNHLTMHVFHPCPQFFVYLNLYLMSVVCRWLKMSWVLTLPLPTAYPYLWTNSPFPVFTMLLYLTSMGE
jgi:hypothetical protein